MIRTLRDFSFAGKRVLLRCDLNVPLDRRGNITDDFRIQESIPTIEYLVAHKAKVVIMSHLGDPKGKRAMHVSLTGVQEKLLEYLDYSITKATDCVGKDIAAWTHEMQKGEILLLENLRFHRGEEENSKEFALALAQLGDIYINDAFSVSHRNHASVARVPALLPSGIGLLFQKELRALESLLQNPPRPFVALVGGNKAQDKLAFAGAISKKADHVLLGNVVAAAKRGSSVPRSGTNIVLPLDGVPGKGKEFDIGPKTQELFEGYITEAGSVFWAGPLGWVEKEEYAKGSLAIAKAIGKSRAFSIAGGGDLVGFLRSHGLERNFSHVSTAGGAALAFLSGAKLPGLQAIGYYGN